MLINFTDLELNQNDEITLPDKTALHIPPLKLYLVNKYRGMLVKFAKNKKTTPEEGINRVKEFTKIAVEWLNTNIEGKEITMEYINKTFNERHLNRLLTGFAEVLVNTEKK